MVIVAEVLVLQDIFVIIWVMVYVIVIRSRKKRKSHPPPRLGRGRLGQRSQVGAEVEGANQCRGEGME